jgi:hypothetical protein
MPAVSEKQKKFMDAVAHNKGFAKKVGVPQSVGAEFSDKSKGMKFGSGGSGTRADRQVVNQPKTDHGAMALFKQGGRMATKMNPGFMAMMAKKKDAKPSAMGKPTMKAGMSTAKDGMKKPTPMANTDMAGMKKGGMPMKKMASGGMAASSMGKVKTAAPSKDGVASKGKTKGMMPKMAGNKIGTGPAMKKGGMTKKYC